jgi:plasmid stabilization system protein ParE
MKLVWSSVAVERALEAKAYIAADNPNAAEKWAEGLILAVQKLKRLPRAGRVVPEIGLEEYRELIYGNYRVVYRVSSNTVFILTVRHLRRLLELDDLGPEA